MIINYEKSEMKSIVWYIEICREQYEVDFRVDEHSVVHKFAPRCDYFNIFWTDIKNYDKPEAAFVKKKRFKKTKI